MTERVAFHFNRPLIGAVVLCIGLCTLGFAFAPIGPVGSDPRNIGLVHAIIVVVCLGFLLQYLRYLLDSRAQVVLDRDGITVTRALDAPIPWTQVERVEMTGKGQYAKPRLVLTADSPLARERLFRHRIVIHDSLLVDGRRGVRQAIARLAPQVPQDW
jgi:hypothetical protein